MLIIRVYFLVVFTLISLIGCFHMESKSKNMKIGDESKSEA